MYSLSCDFEIDELFDWLSVLLDDDHVDVEKQPVVVTSPLQFSHRSTFYFSK